MKKNISLSEWLTKSKIYELLTQKEVENIEEFYNRGEDYDFPDEGIINCMTGSFILDVYVSCLEGKLLDMDIQTLEKLIKQYALIKMKIRLLDACMITYDSSENLFRGDLETLDNAIAKFKLHYESSDEDFSFVPYFPLIIKYPNSIKKNELNWLIETLEEFREIAEEECLIPLSEEQEEEREKFKNIVEDIFNDKK